MSSKQVGSEFTGNITRVEVIDETGRAYVNTAVGGIEMHLQDEGRTLKLVVRK